MSFWSWSSKVWITTWRRSVSIFHDSSSCPMRSCWKSFLRPKTPPGKQWKHVDVISIHSHTDKFITLTLVCVRTVITKPNQLLCKKMWHHVAFQNRDSFCGGNKSKERENNLRVISFERLIFGKWQPLLRLQSGFPRSHVLPDNHPLSHFTQGVRLVMNVNPDERCSSLLLSSCHFYFSFYSHSTIPQFSLWLLGIIITSVQIHKHELLCKERMWGCWQAGEGNEWWEMLVWVTVMKSLAFVSGIWRKWGTQFSASG